MLLTTLRTEPALPTPGFWDGHLLSCTKSPLEWRVDPEGGGWSWVSWTHREAAGCWSPGRRYLYVTVHPRPSRRVRCTQRFHGSIKLVSPPKAYFIYVRPSWGPTERGTVFRADLAPW